MWSLLFASLLLSAGVCSVVGLLAFADSRAGDLEVADWERRRASLAPTAGDLSSVEP